jgi:hypothetical protein
MGVRKDANHIKFDLKWIYRSPTLLNALKNVKVITERLIKMIKLKVIQSLKNNLHFLGAEMLTFSLSTDRVKREIMANGPLVAEFILYQDFLAYSGGIYQHSTGDRLGFYYAKILGWGSQSDKGMYWIASASFGSNWGVYYIKTFLMEYREKELNFWLSSRYFDL